MKAPVFLRIYSLFLIMSVLITPFFSVFAQTSNDPFFSEQWYLQKIHAPEAWEETVGSADVIVAILDAGVDLDHTDLINQYWRNKNEIPNNQKDDDGNGYEDDVQGWDFVDNDPVPNPVITEKFNDTIVSHGTVIAGIIGAEARNNEGIVGINHHISLMPLRILNENGLGSTFDVRQAIQYAVNNGAHVINLSFTSDRADEQLRQTIAWAVDQGVVVVAAVGNGNRNLSQKPTYPACYDAGLGKDIVIGVAATDQQDKKASFSNFGETCTDVSAPGTNIFGTVYHDPSQLLTVTAYGSPWEGTSIAAPMVSATAALMKSRYPSLTPEQIRLAIKLSVDSVNESSIEARKRLGAGRLNVASALRAAKVFAQGQGSVLKRQINHSHSLVVAEGKGEEPRVKRVDANGKVLASFLAYSKSFKGGVSVAMGDVTGDGVEEIVTGAGVGGGPQVRIFDLDGKVLAQFFAYDPSDRNGILVSVGDTNEDGQSEIVVVSQTAGTGEARIFNQHGQLKGLLRPFGRENASLRLSFGNMDDDSADELIFSLLNQPKSVLRVLDGDGRYVRDIFLFETLRHRTFDIGDLDGDGKDEIVFGAARGQYPSIDVYTTSGTFKRNFSAYSASYKGGVNVCVGDIDQNGREEIYTTSRAGGGPQLRIFEEDGHVLGGFFAFDEKHRSGMNCAMWN